MPEYGEYYDAKCRRVERILSTEGCRALETQGQKNGQGTFLLVRFVVNWWSEDFCQIWCKLVVQKLFHPDQPCGGRVVQFPGGNSSLQPKTRFRRFQSICRVIEDLGAKMSHVQILKILGKQ